MFDSNLNWVKVKVHRAGEIGRAHAAISDGLARGNLRPPIGDEIVVQFADMPASDGVEAVRYLLERGFGRPLPAWIVVEEGLGNAAWIYREAASDSSQ
jgi:hypothetical protein